jgi:hypothetical protein
MACRNLQTTKARQPADSFSDFRYYNASAVFIGIVRVEHDVNVRADQTHAPRRNYTTLPFCRLV